MCIGYNSPGGQGIMGLFQNDATKKLINQPGGPGAPSALRSTAGLMALQGAGVTSAQAAGAAVL